MTSVSESPPKMAPCCSSSALSWGALVRFPLWATASFPSEYSTVSGCAFLCWLTPGGGVADVADGRSSGQRLQVPCAEDVLHQPHLSAHVEGASVGTDDARRLLSPVLQRVQSEVGEVGGL